MLNTKFKRKVRTVTNSLTIAVPKEVRYALGITGDTYVEISVNEKGQIIIEKIEE